MRQSGGDGGGEKNSHWNHTRLETRKRCHPNAKAFEDFLLMITGAQLREVLRGVSNPRHWGDLGFSRLPKEVENVLNPHIHFNLNMQLSGWMRVWKGLQWGGGGPPECLAAERGLPAQADTPCEDQQRVPCPHSCISPWGMGYKRKARGTGRHLLAASWHQLLWVGLPRTKEARLQILKRLDSTKMRRAPKLEGSQVMLDPEAERNQVKSYWLSRTLAFFLLTPFPMDRSLNWSVSWLLNST